MAIAETWTVDGYEPLRGRAAPAQLALAALAGVDLIALGVDPWPRSEIQEGISVAQFVGFVVCAFFFVRWFHRAYRNLMPLGVPELRFGTGWAIGGWFVPILDLWRPKQIANDIWRGSDPMAPPRQEEDWSTRPVHALLTAWWFAFIASWLVPAILARIADERAALVTSDLFDATGAVLAILVVRLVTARQGQRAERLGAAGAV